MKIKVGTLILKSKIYIKKIHILAPVFNIVLSPKNTFGIKEY